MIQLGTRWRFGAEPPASLDPGLVAAVRDAEAEVLAAGVDEGEPGDGSWTLTFLEGRPIASLDLVTRAYEQLAVTVDARGDAVIVRSSTVEDGEGW